MISLTGNWNINWPSFAPRYGGATSLDQFCTSPISVNSKTRHINDLCPVSVRDGVESHYIKIVPYGNGIREVNDIVDNCGFLTYVYNPLSAPDISLTPAGLLNTKHLFRQRGMHSEATFINAAGEARQIAPWHEMFGDRPFHLFHDNRPQEYIMHIFRLDLPWLTVDRQTRQKREILKWIKIFNKHTFPLNLEIDPVDFTTVSDLANIARKLIARAPNSETGLPPVNCVQWSCQAVSLALNYPLTRSVVRELGMTEAFEKNWSGLIDYSDDDLEGINMLPVRFYTPARLIQSTFDLYCPEFNLVDLLRFARTTGMLDSFIAPFATKVSPDRVKSYLDAIIATGDIDIDFDVGTGMPFKTVMPSTFILESRLHARNPPTNAPILSYVATALPKEHVCPVNS
ncbi:MAG TPA: hypothetical protein PKM57_03460 [Kiritimatiellia bacterium]|nr:hypothetical protein [Kiritimatiellia bacterium]